MCVEFGVGIGGTGDKCVCDVGGSSDLRIMVAGAYLFDHDPVADDPHTVIYSCVGGDLWNSGLVLVAGRWA